MDIKPILRTAIVAQAAALAAGNLQLVRKKKKTSLDFIKAGSSNIVGTSLLGAQASLVEGM